jgi:hypothetical protein
MALFITKSNFMSSLQCQKRLWLEVKEPNRATALAQAQQRIINQGNEVGRYARQQFPGGRLIAGNSLDAIQETQQATLSGASCLFEAAFVFDDLLIRCDILLRNATGDWELIEVKSSGKVKDEHIEDVALQKYVLTGVGITVNKTKLMHINTQDCVYPHLFNIFTLEDITSKVDKTLNKIPSLLQKCKTTLASDIEPEFTLGKYCDKPNPCPFKDSCWQGIPEASIFTIPRLHEEKLKDLVQRQIFDLLSLPTNFPLTENQRIYVDSIQTKQPMIDQEAIATSLTNLQYPLHFFDFETHNPAIPRFNGLKPYEQFPFQYSCHVLPKDAVLQEDDNLEHYEYLHTDESDPRASLVADLVTAIGRVGSVIVYHKSFESNLLRRLAQDFPRYRQQLESIANRLWDQEDIFKKHYKHPAFLGKTSIKKVLPILVPGLSYDDLKVKRGDEAQAIWDEMIKTSEPVRKQQMTADLKAYCKLDTLAMVKIHEALIAIARQT